MELSGYKNTRVLVTGHTGFKGAWLCRTLLELGARVMGYALPPTVAQLPLWHAAGLEGRIRHVEGDVRDFDALGKAVADFRPEVVFHLAAQPLVQVGFEMPRETLETNIQGTVNLLEALRTCDAVRSVVVVTTDKVYARPDDGVRVETDPLGGDDPYSAGKACAELVAACYRASFFAPKGVALSTVRAGNVIGGGDLTPGRIVPDCIAAAQSGKPLVLRRPGAVRPYQHVLEAVYAYLLLAARQTDDLSLAGSYNIGPDPESCLTAQALAELVFRAWGTQTAIQAGGPVFPEDSYLSIDSSKFRAALGWNPVWPADQAVEAAVRWAKSDDPGGCMPRQITGFFAQAGTPLS